MTHSQEAISDILSAGGHNGGSHRDIHVLKTPVPGDLLKAWKAT
jgi:hypothetical protein